MWRRRTFLDGRRIWRNGHNCCCRIGLVDFGLYLRITGGIGRLWERSLILLRSILLVLVILRRSLHHSIGRIILERLILMKGRLLQIEKMLSIRLGWFHTCLSLALV